MDILHSISPIWIIIFYIIACHGLVQILIYSPLFDTPKGLILFKLKYGIFKKKVDIAIDNVRNDPNPRHVILIGDFLDCAMCLGFWVGFLTTVFLFHFLTSIACGFFISATCYFLDILHKIIEKKAK